MKWFFDWKLWPNVDPSQILTGFWKFWSNFLCCCYRNFFWSKTRFFDRKSVKKIYLPVIVTDLSQSMVEKFCPFHLFEIPQTMYLIISLTFLCSLTSSIQATSVGRFSKSSSVHSLSSSTSIIFPQFFPNSSPLFNLTSYIVIFRGCLWCASDIVNQLCQNGE